MNPSNQFVKENYQKAFKGPHEDKWENVREFMQGKEKVLAEPKINGNRVFVWKKGDKTFAATKHNGVYTQADHPKLFKEFNAAPDETVMDGELVKHDSYNSIRVTGQLSASPTLYVFDVLYLGGKDVRFKQLYQRKLLISGVGFAGTFVKVVPCPVCETVHQVKHEFAARVEEGYEGLVLKDPFAPYGKSNSWLKVRDTDTIDVFVTQLDPADSNGVVWTYEVGLYPPGPGERWYGRVSSATVNVDRSKIQVGTVLEVRFNRVGGKIVFPGTVCSIRTDKSPDECTTDQITVNES